MKYQRETSSFLFLFAEAHRNDVKLVQLEFLKWKLQPRIPKKQAAGRNQPARRVGGDPKSSSHSNTNRLCRQRPKSPVYLEMNQDHWPHRNPRECVCS